MTLKKYFPHLLIILLVISAYLPSFSGDFIFDDNSLVKNNPYVQDLHSLSSYLTQEDGIVDDADKNVFHTGYYRPLLNFTYFIDYKIWGMNAFGFRFTNIFLHLISCLVIFHLLLSLQIAPVSSLFAVLFFALHPTGTESVSMVICRNNLLVTIFSVSSLIFYMESCRGRKYFSLLAALFFFLALLSKETAVMLIPIFFMLNRLIRPGKCSSREEIISYMPLFLLVFFYLLLRWHLIGAFISPIGSENFPARLLFSPYIIAYNFVLVFFPVGLHSLYIRYPSSFIEWNVLVAYMFLIMLGVGLWKFRKKPLLTFSLISCLIAMFPVLHLIPIASPSIITMRWLYFPSAFLSIAIAYMLQSIPQGKKIFSFSIISILLIYLGAYSFTLNDTLWKNQRSFLDIEVKRFGNVLFAAPLADALLDEKKYDEAEALYVFSLNAFPDKAKTYINYSALLINTGRTEEAKKILIKAKALVMTSFERCEWFNNMGVVCINQKQTSCALENLNSAVKNCPDNKVFRHNLQMVDQLRCLSK